MKIHTRVPGIALRGEMARLPLSLNRTFNIINYWLRIQKLNDNRLTKDAYKLQLKWVERDKQCWLKNVKNILFTYGFAEVWFHQGVGDINVFKMLLKQRISDIGIQNWQTEVNSMDRLKYYRIIKEQFQRELYIDRLEPKDRSVIANFRCTGLSLRVLIGVYYEKIDYQACLCELCEKEKNEHEYHFLLECATLTPLRKKHLCNYYWNPPTVNKYINLMNRSDFKGLSMVANYLHDALTFRSEFRENRSNNTSQLMHVQN